MSNKKGYTLIEITVVAIIISLIIGSYMFVSTSARKLGNKDEKAQEYYRLLISLQGSLKRDLRSCLTVRKPSESSYEILVIKDIDNDTPVTATVTYTCKDSQSLIIRTENGKKTLFDFRDVTPEESFIFDIVIPHTLTTADNQQ